MKIDVILGLQWGDEGKGKIVDFLAEKYDIVARFQGGPNAGHTLKFGGKLPFTIEQYFVYSFFKIIKFRDGFLHSIYKKKEKKYFLCIKL